MSADEVNPQVAAIQPLNDQARKQRIEMLGQKTIVGDSFSIEQISSLWLLKAVSDAPVEVNGVSTFEVILQGGETILSGTAAFRFSPAAGLGAASAARKLPLLEIALLLLLVIGLGLWFAGQHLGQPERFVAAPHIRAAPRPQRGPVNGADPRDVIAEARLDLSLYQFYIRERDANDGYLKAAVLGLDDIQKRLATIQAPPDLVAEVQKSKNRAETLLKETVTTLKNNAIVASLAGRQSEYRDTLDRIIQIVQDPADPNYRWALLRLESAGA